MNLGMSVLAFLGIGIVVMALFCLITRYFNKKLQKALEDQNQVYSMIQEIRGKGEIQDEDGEYQNYVNKRQNDQEKSNNKNQPFEIQMTDMRDPLKGNGEDIYGLGRLKKRLQGDSIPINPQTGRSLSSLKSFQPERLDSKRMNTVSSRSKSSDSNGDEASQTDPALPKRNRKEKKKQNIVYHKYISRIVAYLEQGILLIENNMLSISKKQNIQQKRNIKKSTIKPNQTSFDDTLQAYGFQKGTYCAYKFETTLEIPHMKQNEDYPVVSLKSTEKKQEIEFPQFYNLRDKLQDSG